MSRYYEHFNDFDGLTPSANIMPSDVKRLISHTKHEYKTRYYFFSPSERILYRYYDSNDGNDHAYKLYGNYIGKNNKTIRYQIIPDSDDGTNKTDTVRDSLFVSDRFIKRIENMNKLILPSLR